MKVYKGYTAGGRRYVIVRKYGEDGQSEQLDPCFWIRMHSPDGFNWGYGGSGPAQLALAICYDVLGDREQAEQLYQRFKFRVIGTLTGDSWELTESAVRAHLESLAGEPAFGQRDTEEENQ